MSINTHITQNNTPCLNKTSHKATQIIKDTLHTMNTTQKIKPSVYQAVEAYRVARCRGSNVVHTIGSETAIRLSALLAGRALLLEYLLVLISVDSDTMISDSNTNIFYHTTILCIQFWAKTACSVIRIVIYLINWLTRM
jgi:hypothetical protein